MREDLILANLITNDVYARKVLPFLRREYFQGENTKIIFDAVDSYIKKYNTLPTKEAIETDLENKNLDEERYNKVINDVRSLSNEAQKLEWLVDNTEKYCQDRAIYNAIMQSIQIIDGKDPKHNKNALPSILSDALAVSFDNHIGHDYLEDSDIRFESYRRQEKRVPFDLDLFNKITRGGLPQKSLNIILAGTGVGKTMFMCHCAAGNLSAGYNVLYITMEMGETGDPSIGQRIDANLLNITPDELSILPKDVYDKKIDRVRSKTKSKLIVKEYPTASAGSIHFRSLIEELRLKKNFIPDIIYIDYLNICMSSRLKHGNTVNSYTYIKAIAEELRGLAVEYKVPIVSATQTTRSGFTNADLGLEDTSESFGLPATADFMFALITTDELAGLNQVMVKQLKNRYSDPNMDKRFVIGIDKPKMRFYDTEQSSQEDILEGPVMDRTGFGERDKEETFGGKKRIRNKIKSTGFNF